MPKDTEITQENNRADIPQPVRLALAVLDGLEQERAEKLRRALPAYAMTLARQGRAVTKQVLQDALAKGDDAVMGPRPAFTKAAETVEQRYERISGIPLPKAKYSYFGDNPEMPADMRFGNALIRGDLSLIKNLAENNTYIPLDSFLCMAAEYGHLEIVRYQKEQGADIQTDNDYALRHAAGNGHLELVKYLIENGADIHAENNQALHWATRNKHLSVVKYLVDNGANLSRLGQQQHEIKPILENMNDWNKKTGAYPPEGLENTPPGSFDPISVNAIGQLISKEGYDKQEAIRYAYNAVRLFGTTENVMVYFEKWAKPGRQPLHDVIQMISVPDNVSALTSWASAVMEHGPEMARLVKFANKLPQPARSADGKGWSLTKTRNEAAKFAFAKGPENPELAALFNRHSKQEDDFNIALDIVTAYKGKVKDLIPNITIDGEKFDLPKAVFKKLPDGDYRGLVLGELTDCCQSIGGAGQDCAKHGFTSENGGFYVVAVNDNKKGEEIIGQSWAWRGKKGELVLDSLETLGDRVKPEQWTKLAQAFAKALETTDVTALHIGKGGDTPRNMPFETATPPAQPVDYNGYRDSNKQYKITLKKAR